MSGRVQSGYLSTSGALENHVLSSIHENEKYFEIPEFSGEWVSQIPTIFMQSQLFSPFAITGLQ